MPWSFLYFVEVGRIELPSRERYYARFYEA